MTIVLYSRGRDGNIHPPRTKKNHGKIALVGNHHRMFPGGKFVNWERGCKAHSIYDRMAAPIGVPVNCRALIYREKRDGDAVGFYQAIADCLQTLGVVADDRWIVSWDGTRLLKDPDNPRVEIILEAIPSDLPDPPITPKKTKKVKV